jgi:pyruvate,water dikinase
VFRLNPVTSDLRQIVVEHVDGLGTAVVNGEVGVRRNLLDVGALPGADGLLGMVGRMSVEVSSAFGAPQDIEWGFDGREIIVFQARPITATGRSEVPSARDPGMPLERRTVGIPAFRGYGAGTLMAVDRQTDLAIVPDGAILLLRGADVGMEVVPALRRARGLLVGGGILSHIAVVAREYRVPCLAVDRSGIDALDDCLGREVFLDAVEGSVSLMCPPPL